MTIKINDIVYIKSNIEKLKLDKFKVICINKEFAIIENLSVISSCLYRKVPLFMITTNKKEAISAETIKKGDLVNFILDNYKIEKGIVINSYKNFIVVLHKQQKKRVSKNKVIVIT